jgi:hypothetical protein
MATVIPQHRPSAARLQCSPETIELDGSFTRREVADALKALAFDPRERSRRAILLDRDVRDLLVAVLDR